MSSLLRYSKTEAKAGPKLHWVSPESIINKSEKEVYSNLKSQDENIHIQIISITVPKISWSNFNAV